MKKVELLRKEHLTHILSPMFDYPLTILEAPMGYGKSTAARSFLKSINCKPLWISFLNVGETSQFFWDRFSSEFEKVEEATALQLRNLCFPSDLSQIEKAIALMNSITYRNHTVIVIDDFHLSPDSLIYQLIKRITAERIENLHIMIITRDTTNLDFTELLSRGLCYIISQQKLKFTKSEIHNYCKLTMETISDSDIEKISDYSDGWISLIYILLLGLDNGIPVGMSSTIDELVGQVLRNQYDEQTRAFLYQLSIMDTFTAKQAAFVTGEANTQQLLKKLCKENAFIYYDQGLQTYKIHNVLLDFLRLNQSIDSEILYELYNRLGEWHLQNQDYKTAYRCFYITGNVERVLNHLNDPANITNSLSRFEGSNRMFQETPLKLLYQYPLAYLQHILLLIVTGDKKIKAECKLKLNDLTYVYENMEDIDESYRNRILAEILIFKRFVSFNIIEPDDGVNNEILRLLDGRQSAIMNEENEFTFGSPHLLYVYFRDQGTFKQLSQLAIERFSTYSAFANGCGTGSESLIPAEYALETGAFEKVEIYCQKAIYSAKHRNQYSIMICAYFTLIRLYLYMGKIKEAIELFRQLEADISTSNSSICNTALDLCKGYLYACLGQKEMIPLWLQSGDTSNASLLYQGIAFHNIIYGKVLMLSKDYATLEALTDTFHAQFSNFNNQLGFLHNRIFKAVALYHQYGEASGIKEMEGVIEEAKADAIIMPLIENAPHIMELLRKIGQKNPKEEFITRILSCCEQYLKSLDSNQTNSVKLTSREIDVLSLAAEGLKREEIATRLYLSQGTVKTHLQNIYQKLEVSGKISAIKVAQLNGLI